MNYDFMIFLGRCNPLHNGHMHLFKEALKQSDNLIILLGSAECSRSPHDPFSAKEREDMINVSVREDAELAPLLADGSKKIWIRGVADFTSNDKWVACVQAEVDDVVYMFDDAEDANIGLIGFDKDFETASYLKLFPQWNRVDIPHQFSTINATEIRKAYIQRRWILPPEYHAPPAVARFMKEFAHMTDFKWLVEEAESNAAYDPRAFDNDIVSCVDAVVIQSGHILLVERGKHPGLGLLALPGGHVDKRERFKDGAVRELKEETRIADMKGEIPPGRLASFITKKEFFDNPNRSLRARVVSMAYLFRLPDGALYKVRGDDDAARAQWYKLSEIEALRDQFFEDHWNILQTLLAL